MELSPTITNAYESDKGRYDSIPNHRGGRSVNSVNNDLSFYNDASFFDGLFNQFTGNLDYSRQLESAIRAEQFSASEAEKARSFSASEAEKLRAWQENMSNTAYSRAIADLKKNGINPYAIGNFGQSTTPSGSVGNAFMASGHAGSYSHSGSGFSALFGLIESAYKERQVTKRQTLNALIPLIRLLK